MRGEAAESREGDCLNGKYLLEAMLGAGGMGEVYRATNLGIGRVVAIKLLKPEFADRPSVVERFLREARAANIVRHKNVVEVLDIDKDDTGTPFIVQEYLEGEDFSSVLDRFPDGVPPSIALSVLAPIVEAVRAAHERGVVHRDLKPENVFLAEVDGVIVPKVLDFGISKLPGTSDADVRLTGTHSIMGSPQFMSPEQILTPQEVDARSDIWSLGVMLFQCLSGRLPFEGETAEVLFVQICRDDPLPLSEVAPHLPETISQIVSRCLQRDPGRRFQNAMELSDALKQLRKSVRFSDSMVGSVGERGPIKPETLIGRDDTRSRVTKKPSTREGHPGVAAQQRPGEKAAAAQTGTRARQGSMPAAGNRGTAHEFGDEEPLEQVDSIPAPALPTRVQGSKRAPSDATRAKHASAGPAAATGRTYQGVGQRATPSQRARSLDADLDPGSADPLTLATQAGKRARPSHSEIKERPNSGSLRSTAPGGTRSTTPGASKGTPSAVPVGPRGFDVGGMIAGLQAAMLVVVAALVSPWFAPEGLARAYETFGGQLTIACFVVAGGFAVASLNVVRVAQRFTAWTLYGASAGLLLEGVSLGMLGIMPGGGSDVGALPALPALVGPIAALFVTAGFSLYGLKRAQEELVSDGTRGVPYGLFLLVLSLGGLLATFRVAPHAMSIVL